MANNRTIGTWHVPWQVGQRALTLTVCFDSTLIHPTQQQSLLHMFQPALTQEITNVLTDTPLAPDAALDELNQRWSRVTQRPVSERGGHGLLSVTVRNREPGEIDASADEAECATADEPPCAARQT